MNESGSKSSQPLASTQEKDGTEKQGRGRPYKQPMVSPGMAPSEVPTLNQREARIRVPPKRRKPPQLWGGNQGADPRNWMRKRKTSPRSPRRRSSDHSLAAKEQIFLGTGRSAPSPLPAPTAHNGTRHQVQALFCGTHGSRIWLSPCALPKTPVPS